jgi:regulator of RNase E activity RraA
LLEPGPGCTALRGGDQLAFSGVDIRPGAIASADADGVVAVPRPTHERVADVAEGIEQVESEIVAARRAARTLGEARETFGYHNLRRRWS